MLDRKQLLKQITENNAKPYERGSLTLEPVFADGNPVPYCWELFETVEKDGEEGVRALGRHYRANEAITALIEAELREQRK